MGNQYDWLARYTNSKGINDLELCIHTDDTVEGFIKNDVELHEGDDDRYYKLVKSPSQEELNIFLDYHYPLFDMTKLDMERISKESGFIHIMEKLGFAIHLIKISRVVCVTHVNTLRMKGLGEECRHLIFG